MCFAGAGSIGTAAQGNIQAAGNAASLETQARQEELSSNERTRRIRAKGQRFLAEQRVQTSMGNIEQSGSALEVGKADAAQIELDALTELYGGQAKAAGMREQGRLAKENSIEGLHRKISPSRALSSRLWGKGADPLANTDKMIWGW